MDTEEDASLKGQPSPEHPMAAESAHAEGAHAGEGDLGRHPESAVPATATDVALEQDA
jgi:hypothetical protein